MMRQPPVDLVDKITVETPRQAGCDDLGTKILAPPGLATVCKENAPER